MFDAVNALPFRRGRAVLKKAGVAVTINPVAEAFALNALAPLRGGRRLRSVFVEPRAEDLEVLSRWIGEGLVRPVIDRTFRLDEAAEAQRYSEGERARGKIVLVVDAGLAAFRPGAA